MRILLGVGSMPWRSQIWIGEKITWSLLAKCVGDAQASFLATWPLTGHAMVLEQWIDHLLERWDYSEIILAILVVFLILFYIKHSIICWACNIRITPYVRLFIVLYIGGIISLNIILSFVIIFWYSEFLLICSWFLPIGFSCNFF